MGHEVEVPGTFHNVVHKLEETSSILTHFKTLTLGPLSKMRREGEVLDVQELVVTKYQFKMSRRHTPIPCEILDI